MKAGIHVRTNGVMVENCTFKSAGKVKNDIIVIAREGFVIKNCTIKPAK